MTPKYAKTEIVSIKRALEPLIGHKIVDVDAVFVDNQVWPILYTKWQGKEYMLQAIRDPEYNGPGAFSWKEV